MHGNVFMMDRTFNSSGGVSAETYTDKTALGPMLVDDVMVTPIP